MRIFPEGSEEWTISVGNGMLILSAFMLAFAVPVFLFNYVHWRNWPRVAGTVTSASIEHRTEDSGGEVCGTRLVIGFTAGSRQYKVGIDPTSFNSDCSNAVAEQSIGSTVELYDPEAPRDAYRADDKLQFFVGPVALGALAFAFSLGGLFGRYLGRYMQERGLKVP